MSDLAPFYNYLGHPVERGEMAEDQRAIVDAAEAEIGIVLALSADLPGEIGAMLARLTERGWWVEIKTPVQPDAQPYGALYWVGLTPLGVSGWNGRPDHQVGDLTLRGALWRVILLMLLTEKQQAALAATAARGADRSAGTEGE